MRNKLTDQDHRKTIPTKVSGGSRFQPTRSALRANLVLGKMAGDGNAAASRAEPSDREPEVSRPMGLAVSRAAPVCDIYPGAGRRDPSWNAIPTCLLSQ